MNLLPEEEQIALKKRNRATKLSPKVHKIAHESGRRTKNLWQQIVTKSKKTKN